MKKQLTVCYFGIYNSNYTRNRILRQGLEENNVKVIECNTREPSFRKYGQLIKKYFAIQKQCDVIIVGFPGHPIVPLAWILGRLTNKKIIFDVFVSLYDSIILDRKSHSRFSLSALKYWFLDWISCQMSDLIISEVNAYTEYFVKTFKIKRKKFKRIFVGSDDKILYPRKRKFPNKEFLVHFHGTYLPIQGIPYIIKSAKILEKENIRFKLIGKIETYQEAIDLVKQFNLKNVEFIDFMPYEKLAEYMTQADICLGMFGKASKAKRCGAFKIVEALAMKRAIITADTPAIRELLTDRENCLLCKLADEKDLADKILELKNNADLRNKIAENGYELFKQKLTPKVLGRELKDIIEELIKARH
ncbi:MAG: glycosyltransferase [bacterium]